MAKETWKPIRDYPNYEISDHGHVRLAKNKRLIYTTCQKKQQTYRKAQLSQNGKIKAFYIHRLVAEAFCHKSSPDKIYVNHKNGDPVDNRASNLEWVTPSENAKHASQKIKKQKTPNPPETVTRVEFYWIDSDRDDGWETTVGDIEDFCYTEALLVHEGHNSITITSSIAGEGQHLSPLRVPYVAIAGGRQGIIKTVKKIDRKVKKS